jgi:hypothetical protein
VGQADEDHSVLIDRHAGAAVAALPRRAASAAPAEVSAQMPPMTLSGPVDELPAGRRGGRQRGHACLEAQHGASRAVSAVAVRYLANRRAHQAVAYRDGVLFRLAPGVLRASDFAGAHA